MLTYNLLDYIDNYSMISGSLLNSYKYGENDDVNENNDDNYMVNNEEKTTRKYS